MLKRRQYIALYKTSVQTDPDTGKQKRVSVYVGPMYALAADDARKRRAAGWLLALCAASLALFVAYGFVNSAGSRCFYVLPLYLFTVFPLFYLCWGAARLWRLKPRFTEVDKDESLDRLHVSALGLCVLCALHTVGEAVFLLLGGANGLVARELLCAGMMLLTGACALYALRLLGGLKARVVDEGKAPNPAV